MADRVEIKTITVPGGTAIATPQATSLIWREGYAERVEIRIPPGPSGLVGVALARSGRKLLPKDEDEWLITDDEAVIWPLENFGTSASWSVLAYNLDIYSHVFQVRMLLKELRPTGYVVSPPLDVNPPLASDESEQESPDFTDYPEEMPV